MGTTQHQRVPFPVTYYLITCLNSKTVYKYFFFCIHPNIFSNSTYNGSLCIRYYIFKRHSWGQRSRLREQQYCTGGLGSGQVREWWLGSKILFHFVPLILFTCKRKAMDGWHWHYLVGSHVSSCAEVGGKGFGVEGISIMTLPAKGAIFLWHEHDEWWWELGMPCLALHAHANAWCLSSQFPP